MFYIRHDQADIRVSVDFGGGQLVPLFGSWATYEDGALEADDQKTRPGGMGRQVAIGGPGSRADVTCTIQFTDIVAAQAKALENRVGRGRIKFAVTYLDPDGNRTAFSFTRTGFLKNVAIPNVDANAADVSFLSIVGSMDELGA